MKHLKKVIALVLTAFVALAVTTTAFAASITINSTADSDEAATETTEYTYYKILDATIEAGPTVDLDGLTTNMDETAVSYYVTTQAKADAIEGTGLFNVTKDANQNKWYVELADANTGAETIADAFNEIKATFEDASGTFAQTTPGGSATKADLDPGYYLITSTLGDELAIQTLADVEINTKNDYPKIEKTVAIDDASAQIGDTINYTLTLVIPASATDEIVLTDTMTKGLTFDAVNSVTTNDATPATLAAGTDYTVSTVATTNNGSSFTITFPAATVAANKGKTLSVDYTAILNENAAVASSASDTDGNDNTVVLDYGNKYTSQPKTVETDTQSFTFDKVDGSDTDSKLPGAVFELQLNGAALQLIEVTAGEEYRIATAEEISDESVTKVTQMTTNGNVITVNGVDGDVTYQLVEITPPTGYNLPENPSTDVTANTTNTLALTIENNKGTVLPSTGGIGTTIFYVVGGILVAGAAVYLIAKKRASVE